MALDGEMPDLESRPKRRPMKIDRPGDLEEIHAQAVTAGRITSIDLMRGIVMVVMVIDHVRHFYSPYAYDPADLDIASPALFVTRWITHFCAPTFMFLAGTSAWLYARNTGCTRGQLQRFLVSRGLFLVLVELTWVSFCWRFDFHGLVLQAIWALGWSMVLLAGLLYLPRRLLVAFALLLVFGHDLLDRLHFQDFAAHGTVWGWLWAVVHELHVGILPSGYTVVVDYPLAPWVGVMVLGYCFGPLLKQPPEYRHRWMVLLGLTCVGLFFALRLNNLYGEPQPWQASSRGALYTALGVLNVTKYPPSLHYLLMTLGPVLIILPLLERWRGVWAERMMVFGRVPLFFYLVHLPLIHGSHIAAKLVYGPHAQVGPLLPAGSGPSLLQVYFVWALIIVVMYPLCRWYAGYKARHRDYWWCSYV
jgi:uncharacterized membrane protein